MGTKGRAGTEERPYRGVLRESSKMFPESGDRVLLSSQRQENTCPPGRLVAYLNTESRGNYPSEPSIKDVETWLDWQAHQLDMPCCWNVFLPDELSYQDVQQQPFLLTVTYAQGLQYWAERLNPPVDPDFCPLVRSILELRERVREHVIFSKQDIIQGLGRIDPGTTSWWPQPPQLT